MVKGNNIYFYLRQPRRQLQCYADCLDSMIMSTHPSSPEYEYLNTCRITVESIQAKAERMARDVKQRVEALKLGEKLTCAPGESYNLQLNDPRRRIYYHGELKHQPENKSVISIAKRAGRRRRKVHIFILDHVLLMTELVENENNNNDDDDDHFRHSPSFYIKARPLPLQMLAVLTQSQQQQQQQDSESSSVNVSTSSSSGSSSIAGFLSAHMCFPYYHHSSGKQKVTFIHRGRVDLDKQRYQHTFTVGSAQEIEKCLGALEDAKIQRKQCSPGVFQLSTLDDTSFRISSDNWDEIDNVNCTVPIGK